MESKPLKRALQLLRQDVLDLINFLIVFLLENNTNAVQVLDEAVDVLNQDVVTSDYHLLLFLLRWFLFSCFCLFAF